jgi:hypothetical protein
MNTLSLFKSLNLLLLCALIALPLHAEEEPPQADNAGEDVPTQEGDECESDDDCPDGYMCFIGDWTDGATDVGSPEEDDSEEDDSSPDESGGDSGEGGESQGAAGTGVCVLDPYCETNDQCGSEEYCELYLYLDCDENEDGSYDCTSVQEGWCEYDHRDACDTSEQCDFVSICYQRSIDDESYCTSSEEVPCTVDADCGERLVCQDTVIAEMCFWTEDEGTHCETLEEERCGMRQCGNSEECLADEICVRQPREHSDSPEIDVTSGGYEDDVATVNVGESNDSEVPPEEGMCVAPEEGSECAVNADCRDYEECAELSDLPCFDDDERCEDASINICAHLRMECEEDTDCPSEHHCSFYYKSADPFDPHPGIHPEMGDSQSGSSSSPSEDDVEEEDSGDTSDDGESESVHEQGDDQHQDPPPMDVGLCFPEFDDMIMCDDDGCLLYTDQSFWFEDNAVSTDDPDDEGSETGGPNDGDEEEENQGGSGTNSGNTGDGDEAEEGDGDDNDADSDTAIVEEEGSLFSCQSSSSEGAASLIGLLLFLRIRRRK